MNLSKVFVLALAAALVAGCGSGAPSGSGGGGGTSQKEVEFASFQGGYGIDFFQEAGKEWGEKNSRQVKVWGDPRVWEKLKLRFRSGDVPDVTWPGWGMDYWALVYDDQLKPWDEALDAAAPGHPGATWRESFDPGLLKMGAHEGKTYMLPYHVNINAWWFNKTLFDQNGWKVPANWDELLKLNDQIKAKGIAPLTFQGQYPYYMLSGFIYPWIISHGGIQAWNDCQNLMPGAWKSASVLEAAKRVEQLVKRGDFMEGSMGMNHTDSQAAFYQGKAAMIPCGTWLFSEMENVRKGMGDKAPKIEFMRVPILPGGQGDPTAIQVGIEPFVIPADAKDPAAGISIFQYMTTPEKAREFVEKKGTLMAVKVDQGVKYPEHLVAAAKIFDDSKTKWHSDYRSWYPEMGKEAENAMAALLNGDLDAAGFCERLEKAAEKARNDKNLVKRKVE